MSQLETADENFDLALIIEIADGSDEFLVESLEMFLQQSPEQMGVIHGAIVAQDYPLVASAAHKFKANLGFFGMTTSQENMLQIEKLAKAGAGINEIIEKYNEVNAALEPSLAKLHKIMAEKQASL